MQIFTRLLLFLGLVADTADFGLDLEDLVVTLSDQVLDGLESLVTLLHAEETLLPILKQSLLAHHDSLNLDGSFLECVAGRGRFLLLRDELGLVESLLLVKALDLLIHGINKQILLLLGLLEVADVFFGAISRAAGHRDLALHDLVVFLNLLQSAIKLIEFFLGLEDTFKLLISLFLLAFVLTLEDFVLALGLRPVPLHDVVVVVGAFKGSLHTG